MIRFVFNAALLTIACLILYIPSRVSPEQLLDVLRAEHTLNERIWGMAAANRILARMNDIRQADRELGDPLAPPAPVPGDLERRVREALDARLGTHPQTPPAYSAKKIDGERAHRLARRGEAVAPAPALVTLKAWTLVALDGEVATIDLHTSAGFYVRSLAHDVGAALGCGGHLAALRRTGSGVFTIEGAVPLPPPDADATSLLAALRPFDTLLPDWPAAVVTAAGAERVRHGSLIGPDACTRWPDAASASVASAAAADGRGDQPLQRPPTVRLVDEAGRLLALAVWRDGVLHPSVVLG